MKLVPVLGCAAATLLAACTGNNARLAPAVSGDAGWIHAGKIVYHVPHYMPTRSNVAHNVSGILFTYYGGPVLVTPKVYIIFWGYKTYGDPDKVAPLLKDYIKVMGGSAHNNIYTQYYQDVDSITTYITNPKKQLGGVWFDQTNPVPESPSDYDVAVEALNGVAKFGYDANASYVVATPHGHSTYGFGISWCAYHSNTFDGSNLVSYTNFPYIPDAGTTCGSDDIAAPRGESGADEGVTIVEGHEEGESVTDPSVGNGWYNQQYIEIGDACAWSNYIANDQFGKKTYTMQAMYSNASESCVQTYTK